MPIIKPHELAPAYIAYIDEAGDDGLNVVRPIDPNGSAEWLMMGAVIVDASREPELANWTENIITSVRETQQYNLPEVHFKNFNKNNGRLACKMLSELPVRCFVVASNKKNMRKYANELAAQIPSDHWFYCWITRLLLERVTYFALQRSMRDYGRPMPLKIELSERGRFNYGQLSAYYDWLKIKSVAGRTFLPLGDLSWEVMHRDLMSVHMNKSRPGLQLSDIVASAFFRSSDVVQTSRHDPECAKLLDPRIARDPDRPDGQVIGYGVKLMPKWKEAKLTPQQEKIYRFYGYPDYQWWLTEAKKKEVRTRLL